ncbi:uncharacterized protein BDZ99DRAFT_203746 [Mytilinidion resinicola]|uniref:Uncharacterized protein n=1 Tax=Mytilinidion resinicola TaxID=574789 RepID=A0A6A6Y103_9PEZI|nr:uncharacterized protein BDZ99DRAFT_203746 [Mytilinidion resinicola]KAF2802442.1 hypothetical protein BDZ99DRAFT_203746 [Mytilinidion resinicola]
MVGNLPESRALSCVGLHRETSESSSYFSPSGRRPISSRRTGDPPIISDATVLSTQLRGLLSSVVSRSGSPQSVGSGAALSRRCPWFCCPWFCCPLPAPRWWNAVAGSGQMASAHVGFTMWPLGTNGVVVMCWMAHCPLPTLAARPPDETLSGAKSAQAVPGRHTNQAQRGLFRPVIHPCILRLHRKGAGSEMTLQGCGAVACRVGRCAPVRRSLLERQGQPAESLAWRPVSCVSSSPSPRPHPSTTKPLLSFSIQPVFAFTPSRGTVAFVAPYNTHLRISVILASHFHASPH